MDELDLEPELPSIREIAADLIADCDSLNFHNFEALEGRERKALIEALPYLKTAIAQIQALTPSS